MSWQRYRYYDIYRRSTPNRAKGGIRAQSKRGTLGQARFTAGVVATFDETINTARSNNLCRTSRIP